MKRLLWVLSCLALAGCAITTVTSAPDTVIVESPSASHVFPSDEVIRKLLLGVSREEALALIGRTLTIGYERTENAPDQYVPVTSPNPYRSQQITKGKNIYQVDYYLTKISKADGVIAEEELTPLIFEDNKLIGKGWDFFNSKIKN